MNASPALNFKALEPELTYVPLKPKITEAEYWEKYYHYPEITYELKNGELEEKGVSDFLTFLMSDWFSELLGYYLKTHPIAKKTGLEMGFGLPLSSHKKDIRRPDLGIVLNSNPIPLKPSDKSYKGTYDLCIESISDSSTEDVERDTISKKREYAQTGVKEYYILDGHNRYTAFYRLGKRGLYVPIKPKKGDIIQSSVLPGFQFRISDLDTQPLPDEMIDDPVYQGFVLPHYQETKELFRAEKKARQEAEKQIQQAKKQVEKEKQARQKAAQRAVEEKKARQEAERKIEQAKTQVEKEKQARQEAAKRAAKEKQARQEATKRAVEEKQARQEAEQSAKQLAEKLRALGIDPDNI